MNKDRVTWIAGIFIIPFIIYFYFLKWKTSTIYGDDLYMYLGLKNGYGFYEKLHFLISLNKFRPINQSIIIILSNLFQKNLYDYYLFNICIQALNALILARIVNLFLKSPSPALLIGLTIGISRFSFYNISQLYTGGALEGLALTFYLLSVFYLINASINNTQAAKEKRNDFLLSLLFANLSIYTHERYIILFPFLILMVFFFPFSKSLSLKQRGSLSFLALFSIALNYFIKKYIVEMPFFVGTGGTNISFSFQDVVYYFRDGVSSIFQINSHPDYLTGIPFAFLGAPFKAFSIIIAAGISIVFIVFIIKASSNKTKSHNHLVLFLSLIILFIATLIPALVTIRLEQRWLQGSFAIFIILIVIAIQGMNFKTKQINSIFCFAFILLYQLSDFHYLYAGANSLYMSHAQKIASVYKNSAEQNVIHYETKKIYCFVNKREINSENEISWSIAKGGLFEFYRNNSKTVFFIDSVYQRMINPTDTTLAHFNKNTDQIIYVKDSIIDITPQFLTDSLKNFKG